MLVGDEGAVRERKDADNPGSWGRATDKVMRLKKLGRGQRKASEFGWSAKSVPGRFRWDKGKRWETNAPNHHPQKKHVPRQKNKKKNAGKLLPSQRTRAEKKGEKKGTSPAKGLRSGNESFQIPKTPFYEKKTEESGPWPGESK